MGKFARLLAAFYLGFALNHFVNLSFTNWRFYAIVVPFFLLLGIHDIYREMNNKNK